MLFVIQLQQSGKNSWAVEEGGVALEDNRGEQERRGIVRLRAHNLHSESGPATCPL